MKKAAMDGLAKVAKKIADLKKKEADRKKARDLKVAKLKTDHAAKIAALKAHLTKKLGDDLTK